MITQSHNLVNEVEIGSRVELVGEQMRKCVRGEARKLVRDHNFCEEHQECDDKVHEKKLLVTLSNQWINLAGHSPVQFSVETYTSHCLNNCKIFYEQR